MNLDDLRFNPTNHNYPQHRLFAFSGRGSVGIIPDTMLGIGSFFFPPVSGKHFQLFHRLHLPDLQATLGDSAAGTHYTPHRLMLQEIDWLPWRIRRRGVFHHRVGSQLVALQVEHELFAPADGDGLLVRLELRLHSPRSLRVKIVPEMQNAKRAFGVCAATAWNYEIPSAEGIVWSEGPCVWRTDGCTMRLLADRDEVVLQVGKPVTIWLGASLEGEGLEPLRGSLARHAASAEKYWRTRWAEMREKFAPKVDALTPSRQRLFYRAWLTTLTARWQRRNFIAQPFYSAEGIDGGSICSYLWDLAYASKLIAQLEGRSLAALVRRFADPQHFFTGYSLSPIRGHWLGVFYAFDPYALVQVVADYTDATRDVRTLRALLPPVEEILQTFDRRYRSRSGVLDFGHGRHLIELHTAGYEGLVPNPNLEHAWSLQTLNRLRTLAGLRPKPLYARRATEILRACDRLFWNNRAGWFFPEEQRDSASIWSIQILSALRLGIVAPEKVARMAEHMRDGRFLGPYGVYSIARDDALHFTLQDVDWGGAGCYCGHTGIVLEGFARYGLRVVTERILERIEWWGDALPYIPQETRADSPVGAGRPNLVAAGAVCQALLV